MTAEATEARKIALLREYLVKQGITCDMDNWSTAKHSTTNRTIFLNNNTGAKFHSMPSAANSLSSPMQRWLNTIAALPDRKIRKQAETYHENGYLIIKNILSAAVVAQLLDGTHPKTSCDSSEVKRLRPCRTSRAWLGARELIRANREVSGLGVLAERGKGRYDLPLPQYFVPTVMEHLDSLNSLLKVLCPMGTVMTANIMLAAPGAERQNMHTDSASARKNLPPHYITVLIPLTKQDKRTGMTELWPKTHRLPMSSKSGICPAVRIGDALVFDGMLSHLGTANQTHDRERYFFYMAYSTKKRDPNTELTGEW